MDLLAGSAADLFSGADSLSVFARFGMKRVVMLSKISRKHLLLGENQTFLIENQSKKISSDTTVKLYFPIKIALKCQSWDTTIALPDVVASIKKVWYPNIISFS